MNLSALWPPQAAQRAFPALRRRTTSAPEVPGALPILGHALEFGEDPLAFLNRARERYGDVVRIRFPQGERTFLLNPLDHAAYFKNRDLDFAVVGVEFGSRVFGYTPEQAFHAGVEEISHQVGEYMKGDPLHRMTVRMQEKLERRLAELPPGEWRADHLFRWANDFIFAAGTDAIFGDGVYCRDLKDDYTVLDRSFGILAMGIPARLVPGARKAQARMGELLRHKGAGRAELFEHRMALFEERGIPDDVWPRFDSGVMWAAQANTVAAAFWTLLYVLRDEGAREAILEEVRGIREGGERAPGDPPFSKRELQRMEKLGSAIDEVNRLTTAPMVPRRALRETTLELDDGRTLHIEEGADLCLFPPTTHFDPEIYEDPHTFRFDRFLPEPGSRSRHFYKGGKRVHFHLLPFGGGKSMCPGRFFAINEFKITVATLLTWFDVELESDVVPDIDRKRTGFGTYPPVRDVAFRYRRRPS